MTSAPLEHLLHVLDACGTGLGRDDVAWAFESAKTNNDIVAWVDEYLSPATLLTREEHALYASTPSVSKPILIIRSSEKHGVTQNSCINIGPQLFDEDFEAAISSLESSTASIEKQCKLLEAQKHALREIQARNASVRHSDRSDDQRSGNITREKNQLDFEAAELAESLQTRIERSLKQAEGASNGAQPSVERVLEKDDRLLDGLERMVSQLTSSKDESGSSDESERLCQALTTLSSQDIHAQIDAAYHAAARKTANQVNGTPPTPPQDAPAQRDSLRAELEELCREIDGLSTMAVESRFRTPISKALRAGAAEDEAERYTWIAYLSTTLQFLTDRLNTMDDASQQFWARSGALKVVSATLRGLLRSSVDKQTVHMSTQSPTKPSQKGLKPLRLVQANLSESHDPAAQLLRQLDVRSVELGEPAGLSDGLHSATIEKSEKLVSLMVSTEQSICENVTKSLAKANSDSTALLDAVYNYSEFGTTRLAGRSVTENTENLERKTQGISDGMRRLDVDGVGKKIREMQQELLK